MSSRSCFYAGNFNCQHTNWSYTNTIKDGSCLATWAAGGNLSLLYDPKGPASFFSGRWRSETNSDVAFANSSDGKQLSCRRVVEKFPRSQHRPSHITPCDRRDNPFCTKTITIIDNFKKAQGDTDNRWISIS